MNPPTRRSHYSITKCFLISNSAPSFFKAPWTTVNIPALPLEFRFPWSQGNCKSYLMLSSMPLAPLTLPLPPCCSGCNWPCHMQICFPGFLSCFTVLSCPPPQVSSLFKQKHFRVSFTSSPPCFSYCYWLYICFLYNLWGMMNQISPQLWPYQTVVLNFNLLIFPLKKKALRISSLTIIHFPNAWLGTKDGKKTTWYWIFFKTIFLSYF